MITTFPLQQNLYNKKQQNAGQFIIVQQPQLLLFKQMQNLHHLTPQTLSYHNQVDNYEQKEEYLRKTIEVKNKNIDQLLKELRQTKEIYQEYKAQYMVEEKKMKGRVMELTNKVELQTTELDKHKLMINRIRADSQSAVEKEQKNAESYLVQLRQLTGIKNDFEQKYKVAMRESSQLKEKNEMLVSTVTKLEDRSKHNEKQLSICQQELKSAREEMMVKNHQWCEQRNRLLEQLQQMQQRKKQKAKVSSKLQAIQNKIINTLRKI